MPACEGLTPRAHRLLERVRAAAPEGDPLAFMVSGGCCGGTNPVLCHRANILEGFDLAAMSSQPDRYYHTLIEATKLAFADRNHYIADTAFAKVPVAELLSKEYAARRRALIDPNKATAFAAGAERPAGTADQ